MKKWKVLLGEGVVIYLNDKEKEEYLKAVEGGAEFIVLGDRVISGNFQAIIPKKDKPTS